MRVPDKMTGNGFLPPGAIRVPIPKTRDPFVNTPLIPAGRDRAGEDRFWISTWNHLVGCMAVLVTESGRARIYHFRRPQCNGFYSAVMENKNILWLCGDLARVARLTLSTGRYELFETGAPSALVCQGMTLDRKTGKLFAAAHVPPRTVAFSFDYRRRKPVKIYDNVGLDKYMRFSFPNGDGTYSFIFNVPGETLVCWNPQTEALSARRINAKQDDYDNGTPFRLVNDRQGRWYLPHRGWFNPRRNRFDSGGPRPEREMTWFARRGNLIWGLNCFRGDTTVGFWQTDTGKVKSLCTIPNTPLLNTALSHSGKLVAVNMYGEFFRFDGLTGTLELSRRLDTDSFGAVDCLCRIDKKRILGTPFISQRFWEVNIRTGKGYDCGRAAPGGGEILKTWKIGKKVYMAAYQGGELMEYDPKRRPHFPENPRVVADPPQGMRPEASTENGSYIYYACSRPYGNLGTVLTCYDTRSGAARYSSMPELPDQRVVSLYYDRSLKSLLAGTSLHADCQSCPPTSTLCYFARIDPASLRVLGKVPLPRNAASAYIIGPLGNRRFFCVCGMPEGQHFFLLSQRLQISPLEIIPRLSQNMHSIHYAGKPGQFVLHRQDRIELWDLNRMKLLRLLYRQFRIYHCSVQDRSVYLVKPRELIVLENVLSL